MKNIDNAQCLNSVLEISSGCPRVFVAFFVFDWLIKTPGACFKYENWEILQNFAIANKFQLPRSLYGANFDIKWCKPTDLSWTFLGQSTHHVFVPSGAYQGFAEDLVLILTLSNTHTEVSSIQQLLGCLMMMLIDQCLVGQCVKNLAWLFWDVYCISL